MLTLTQHFPGQKKLAAEKDLQPQADEFEVVICCDLDPEKEELRVQIGPGELRNHRKNWTLVCTCGGKPWNLDRE